MSPDYGGKRLNRTTPFTESYDLAVVAACACFYKKLSTTCCKRKKTLKVTVLITGLGLRERSRPPGRI